MAFEFQNTKESIKKPKICHSKVQTRLKNGLKKRGINNTAKKPLNLYSKRVLSLCNSRKTSIELPPSEGLVPFFKLFYVGFLTPIFAKAADYNRESQQEMFLII